MTFKSKARRAGWLLVVAAFAFGLFSAIRPEPVGAYGLLSSRKIQLSSNTLSANNTAYQVSFTTTTATQSVGAIVIKFCLNSPIIGESCTGFPNSGTTGFNTNESTLTVNTLTGLTGFTLNQTLSDINNVVLTHGSAQANVTSGTAVSFTLGNGSTNGLRNPDANTSYYARILLYPTNNPADITSQTGQNAATDAGGIALATTNQLNVTAKVQETLRFCVYTGANCAAGGNAIALGDSNGVLNDTALVYTSTANFDLASNALAGVRVKLKGDTLTSGAFTISPSWAPNCETDSTATTEEQFGVRVSAYGAGQSAPAAGRYDCAGGSHMFDVANTNTTYGDDIVKTDGATDMSTSTVELAAKAAGTTEAGIYTTTLQLIATATY